MFRRSLAVACVLLAISSAAFADERAETGSSWGTVAGRVVFEGDLTDPAVLRRQENLPVPRGATPEIEGGIPNLALLIDDKTRGVAGAFVYLRRKPARIHPALVARKHEPLEVVYDLHLFFPRAMIVNVGQSVSLTSRRGGVNFMADTALNPPINALVTPDKPFAWTPTRREPYPIRVGDGVRAIPVSYWLVVDHPYAAVTKHDGSFRLEHLPAGEIELTVFHEAVGVVAKKLPVTVPSGEVKKLPPLAITLERLKKH